MPTFRLSLALGALLLAPLALSSETFASELKDDAQAFLDLYNSLYQNMTRVSSEASWDASTDVGPENEGKRTAANQAWATMVGDPVVIKTAKKLLDGKGNLTKLQERQLRAILLLAGDNPGTIPDVVAQRIEQESKQASILDSYEFCLVALDKSGKCPEPKTANDIDKLLQESKKLDERLLVWNASKEIGVGLKPGLVELQKLRNKVAREMGYSSFFALQVAAYDMSVDEMMGTLDGFVDDMAPLYGEMQKWATRRYAERYGQAAPSGAVPAHWYTNRWAQEWGGMVEATNLDPYFVGKTPASIVGQAEKFYVSMGFPPLPESFWKKSDLYPATDGRHKNAHASAWHVDLDQDLRSLMSVEANSQWFFTSHHELGHIYYYVSYTRPEVPPVLREGANRGFHEAVGELASMAAAQVPYLKAIGVLPPKAKIDPMQAMLSEALEMTVAFIPWSAGVMSHFEYELYEKNLPPDQWQKRWWEMVEKYQHVAPPSPDRLTDPKLCDACTKTHINDDPGGYYDYAIATVVKYQLHEHIAKKILKQDPHSCNYYGNKEVGAFLKSILEKGGTQPWPEVLKEATGEELSTRAMVEYYTPLYEWLKKENKKAAKKK